MHFAAAVKVSKRPVDSDYEIVGVPKEFKGMSYVDYMQLKRSFARGYALSCVHYSPQRIYIAAGLRLIQPGSILRTSEWTPELTNRTLSDRDVWLLFSLLMWFGSNIGRRYVDDVIKYDDYRFYAGWDGRFIWEPSRLSDAYSSILQSFDSLFNRELPRDVKPFPIPVAANTDNLFVTSIICWLSHEEGQEFIDIVRQAIKKEFALLDAEKENQRRIEQLEKDTGAYYRRGRAELGLLLATA